MHHQFLVTIPYGIIFPNVLLCIVTTKNMAKRFATFESTSSSLLYLSNLNSSGDDVSYLHPKIQTLTRLMCIYRHYMKHCSFLCEHCVSMTKNRFNGFILINIYHLQWLVISWCFFMWISWGPDSQQCKWSSSSFLSLNHITALCARASNL